MLVCGKNDGGNIMPREAAAAAAAKIANQMDDDSDQDDITVSEASVSVYDPRDLDESEDDDDDSADEMFESEDESHAGLQHDMEDSDEDEDEDEDEDSESDKAPQSKKRAIEDDSEVLPNSKKSRTTASEGYKFSFPKAIALLAKHGLHYYDARDYIHSLEVTKYKGHTVKDKVKLDLSIEKIDKETAGQLRKLKNSLSTIATRSKQTSDTTPAFEIETKKISGSGNKDLEEELENLAQQLSVKKPDQEKIQILEGFLIKNGLKKLDGVITTTLSENYRDKEQLSGIYTQLFSSLQTKFPGLSATQLNKFFCITHPTIKASRTRLSNKKLHKRSHKRTFFRTQNARETIGLPPTKPRQPSQPTQESRDLQRALSKFATDKNSHEKIYTFFAKIGLTIYETQSYLLNVASKKKAGETYINFIKTDEFETKFTTNKSLGTSLDELSKPLTPFIRNLKRCLSNQGQEITEQNTTIINEKGSDEINEVIANLQKSPQDCDVNFFKEHLELDEKTLPEILGAEPLGWRSKGPSGTFNGLFNHLVEKFKGISATQLTELYYLIGPSIIKLRHVYCAGKRTEKSSATRRTLIGVSNLFKKQIDDPKNIDGSNNTSHQQATTP